MNELGIKSKVFSLENSGVTNAGTVYWNQAPAKLYEQTIERGEGEIASSGGLVVQTGEFTGRSPKDKFVVEDDMTRDTVWWGDINQPISPENYQNLKTRILAYLQGRDLWVRDAFAGADPKYRIGVRVVNENPWQNMFVHNMFLRPSKEEKEQFAPDWTILCAPGFYGNGPEDGIRQHNFSIVNFAEKTILIGGSAYTGEIKKGIFTVLNYILPKQGVLSMHCSSNIGQEDDSAVFFGLSGTGKTTLSADPNRALIGDDEHGWTDEGVFNFEGGCYAKCIDLTEKQEPQIWNAIKFGALIENTRFHEGTRDVNFADISMTQNTRVAYPIHHISGHAEPSRGPIPKNIFFLTCDAFGVLPPISKLTPGQAMYQFISGYTAKVAGTEAGITEPVRVFSACFGAPFLPLHPTEYADMLGEMMKKHNVNIWLVNTGWSGGAYGTGSRIKLRYTRAMVSAALDGKLDGVEFSSDPIFNLSMPVAVPEVPSEILNPRNTWTDKTAYDTKANQLAQYFNDNFEKYKEGANEEILAAAPKVLEK